MAGMNLQHRSMLELRFFLIKVFQTPKQTEILDKKVKGSIREQIIKYLPGLDS